MKKVIANITIGNSEMALVFTEVLKLFPIDDFELKKMCYHYLNTYALVKPDLALEALPYILADLKSNSPVLIALALRNLVSVPIKEFIRESVRPLALYLENEDPYLRKTAAYSIARLNEKDPKIVQKEDFIAQLNHTLGDNNPAVIASALTALHDITERSDDLKLTINRDHAVNLVELLPRCDEWDQASILNTVLNFVPEKHEDAFLLIDKTIAQLQHANSAVVLNAFKLLLYLLNFVDFIEDHIPKKLASSLTSLLSKPPEIQFLILRNVILLILSKPTLIPFDVTAFFCEYNDPIYVKDTKLEIIYLLANEHNLDVVLRELEEYGTEVDIQMSRKAIRAIGNLAVKLESAAKPCIKVLLNLLSNGIDYVVQEAVIVFKNILRRYDQYDYIVPEILEQVDHVEEPEARSALIWIAGQYCDKITNPETLIADLTFTFREDPLEVQLSSLTACVKLFLRKPQSSEKHVLKILKWATEEVNNPDVRDRGFFYWRLLSIQDKYPGSAKDVIDSEIPLISGENEKLDPLILEELELNIGTLASIYLKPVGQVFRLAKRKFLPDSPARSREASRSSSRNRVNTVSSTRSIASSENQLPGHTERHIDDFDVPAVNVNQPKKQGNLNRHMSIARKSSGLLSRKLSIRGAFH
ncbi:AP-1 complex subunit beta-1 [Wickerhamomyces ciferrii]|uniref:AP complex subunit beta n=1 Tax=Wickerhamomyces ciferrii (strain ATCC 14091 / BCRC 22168 / CBS 111 / JCM 3599 / NBRC 0793 / NRRL Y-1031 F-60-10) TaxID=1206466 RepID=K0KH53_WICCF|nr:AP-1 complex subunit beta-1 [Wickerhamomyces ciferrii]CCH41512.1 AP-1 complex subunit beta-1 [Wickerhamomyces ciferrii]